MSSSFKVGNFEKYLNIVRNELPETRKYFRGQTKLISAGYPLKPSIGRYKHVQTKSFLEQDDLEREVLEVFRNHLVTHVQHLPSDRLGGARHSPAPRPAHSSDGLDRKPTRGALLCGSGNKDGRRRANP